MKRFDFRGEVCSKREGWWALFLYSQYESKYVKHYVIILFEGITTSSRKY